jgi:phenylacetate-CoA ligase
MRLLSEVAGEPDGLTATLAERVRAATGLRAEVDLVPPGSLPNDGRVIEDRRAMP